MTRGINNSKRKSNSLREIQRKRNSFDCRKCGRGVGSLYKGKNTSNLCDSCSVDQVREVCGLKPIKTKILPCLKCGVKFPSTIDNRICIPCSVTNVRVNDFEFYNTVYDS